MKNIGEIVIKYGAAPWPHEMKTAQALILHGYTVIFKRRKEGQYQSSADIEMNGIEWEIKSPISNRLSNVQKTLRKAAHQSSSVIYDSQRVKDLTDLQIEKELRKQTRGFRSLKHVIFVNKKREVIDIK